MEVTILLRYISCGLILYCIDAKSISLNDLIAAEKLNSRSHQEISNIPAHLPPSKEHLPSFEIPTNTKAKKREGSSNNTSGRSRSILKYRKRFPIKYPLKQKKLKYLQKPDFKRKNLTGKREIQRRHVKINHKYIPLLRNIELLFDNILSSDSSETYESRRERRHQSASKKDKTCICSAKHDSEYSYTQEETFTSTSSPSDEVENASSAVTATAQTDNTINDNFSRFRRNQNVPILFARNPTSLWRNYTRLGERSSPTYNGRSQGHISGNNGNSKRNALHGDDASHSEDNDQNSNSDSRNDASCFRFTGIREIGTNTQTAEVNRGTSKGTTVILPSNETLKDDTRNVSEHKGQIELQVRGIETKSPVFLPELTSGLHSEPQEENIPIRSTEDYEKSVPSNISGDKRIIVRNGQIAQENKKVRRTNEAIGPKVVMIFDGYSVARDVNGENKMTEKAIHIHS